MKSSFNPSLDTLLKQSMVVCLQTPIDILSEICYNILEMDRKGIPYFNGASNAPYCIKYHNKGYKNIYTVVLDYWHEWSKKSEIVNLNYGDFNLALERSNVERNATPGLGGCRLCKVAVIVSTYRGTKKLHEEVLFRKLRNMDGKWEDL